MPLVEVHKATVADAEMIAPRMREADVIEQKRAAGFAPLEALVRSLVASEGRALTVSFNGEPAAMGGIVAPSLIGTAAAPWLLASDLVEEHPVAFFRAARALVDAWTEEFGTLVQFVDEEHTQARRFLKHLGFTIYAPVPFGVARAPFCPVVRSR